MSTPAEKIAAAALKWAAAESAKKAAKKAFGEAMAPCFVDVPQLNDWPKSVPLFVRTREIEGYGYSEYWVYCEHAPADVRGQECEGDERWIAQNKAWRVLKEATAKAGAARSALTRMCNRELVACSEHKKQVEADLVTDAMRKSAQGER